MLYALDRYFTDDLFLTAAHPFFKSITINQRIQVHVYRDEPFYLSIFEVDGQRVIKEVLVSDIWSYVRETVNHANLHNFLIEYADKSTV